eukprot:2382846-Pyramimonas_sp.AAC.1
MQGGWFFKIWLSPQRRAHSFHTLAAASRMEGGSFSKCGYHVGTAHIPFNASSSFSDGGRAVFKL